MQGVLATASGVNGLVPQRLNHVIADSAGAPSDGDKLYIPGDSNFQPRAAGATAPRIVGKETGLHQS